MGLRQLIDPRNERKNKDDTSFTSLWLFIFILEAVCCLEAMRRAEDWPPARLGAAGCRLGREWAAPALVQSGRRQEDPLLLLWRILRWCRPCWRIRDSLVDGRELEEFADFYALFGRIITNQMIKFQMFLLLCFATVSQNCQNTQQKDAIIIKIYLDTMTSQTNAHFNRNLR